MSAHLQPLARLVLLASIVGLVGLAPGAHVLAQTPDGGTATPSEPGSSPDTQATPAPSPTSATEPAPAPSPTSATEPEPAPTDDEPAETTDDFRDRWVALGLSVGLYVPSIVNDMGPHVDVGIDATLLLPFIERRLGVVLEVAWSPPGASGSGEDARLGESGGRWTYEMTTQHLVFGLGVVLRFLPPGSTFVPYVGVLGRLYLLETSVEGTGGGQPFGQNTEQSTQAGAVFQLGGELRAGPGAALLEVSFGISDLPHTITGQTSTGALAVELGYRLFL